MRDSLCTLCKSSRQINQNEKEIQTYHKFTRNLGLEDTIKGAPGVVAGLKREDLGHVPEAVLVIPRSYYLKLFAAVIRGGFAGLGAGRIK